MDPVETLTFVAGQTSHIALGTSVLNLPWYNPVLLARRLTTLDILSRGRLRLGVGIGWSPDEYEAAGVPWKARGSRADEALHALKAIWTMDSVEIQGTGFKIPKSYFPLKPVQKPHPPIYMAAYTPGASKDRANFTGTLEQIAEDIHSTRKPGASELVLDVQFSPDVRSDDDVIHKMEGLQKIAN